MFHEDHLSPQGNSDERWTLSLYYLYIISYLFGGFFRYLDQTCRRRCLFSVSDQRRIGVLRACMVIGLQMLRSLVYFPVYFIFREFQRFADALADEFGDMGVK